MNYKLWVITAVSLFIIGLIAGVVLGLAKPAVLTALFSEEMVALQELAELFAPFQATTAVLIFLKNVSVLLFSFILGPILCLMPILALALNGLLISFVSVLITEEASVGLVLAGLLPHGIFEIPALIIGEAAALSFGAAVILALISKERRRVLPLKLRQSLRYLLLAIVLLVPAAIIETFITPLLLS